MIIVRLLFLGTLVFLIEGYLKFKLVDSNGQDTTTSPSGLLLAYNSDHGKWGTVCYNGYRDNSARVICLDMGYPGSSRWWYGYQWSIQSSYDIVLDDFMCDSSDRTYTDCVYSSSPGCTHDDDILLKCNTPCSVNTFLNKDSVWCDPCPSGATSTGGLDVTQCECPAGQYWRFTTCLGCPENMYSSSAGATQCTSCPVGTVASTSKTYCELCPAGTYWNQGDCLQCPEHHFSEKGSTNFTNCTKCPIFTISSPGSETCSSCLLGQFWDDYICIDCPDHMYGNGTMCLECPKWLSLDDGSCIVGTHSDQLQELSLNIARNRNMFIIGLTVPLVILVIVIACLTTLLLQKRYNSQKNPDKDIPKNIPPPPAAPEPSCNTRGAEDYINMEDCDYIAMDDY